MLTLISSVSNVYSDIQVSNIYCGVLNLSIQIYCFQFQMEIEIFVLLKIFYFIFRYRKVPYICFIYVNLACLSVCLYPQNIRTAEPMGLNFFVVTYTTLGKIYGCLNVKDFSNKKYFFLFKKSVNVYKKLKNPQQFDLKKKKWPLK